MRFKHIRWPVLRVAFVAVIMLSGSDSFSQVLTTGLPGNNTLRLAWEQYSQGMYALSEQSARRYLDAAAEKVYTRDMAGPEKANFILVMSAIRLNAPGCADTAAKVLQLITDPSYKERINFALAQYYFRQNDLAGAIPLYEHADDANLESSEVADKDFELAYCYFTRGDFDKAEPLFKAITSIKEGKYYLAGNYYYGLLSYNRNNYNSALQSFDIVKDAREYRAVVPYYIAEIYYFMGKREKAGELADSLIKRKDKSFYDNELHLLAAQCLFEDQKYSDARPYFEYYYQHVSKIRKQDLYEMAYCDYRSSDWEKAIEKFRQLSTGKDSLGQTSLYLLGDCYLNTTDLASARNAFGLCADMSVNKAQQEAAMMLYSRLSYQTGFDDEALRQLKNLLKTFPYTTYRDEANTLISGLLLKTNDYEGALKHLDNVEKKDEHYKRNYQLACFGYAVTQYRKGDLTEALSYFDKALKHPVDAAYESACLFWKGEIAFRQHHFDEVINYSLDFISRKNEKAVARISPLATYQHAYLNMGYAAMETRNYSSAQNYFSHASQEHGSDNFSTMVAAVREADAVFMQKDFSRALTLYDRIIVSDTLNADYASYQKAILLGLQGRNNDKLAVLQSLYRAQPPSAYANHARYEAAVTYIESDKFAQALSLLHYLTDTSGDRSFAPQSWMKAGFIFQQLNETDNAINAYKEVVTGYPGSDDRPAALEALKSLYIQSNQPAAYTQMLRANNLPSADSSSLDSTYYAAAEAQFGNSHFDAARQGFDNYLRQYPHGIFAMKAHYYRAESNYQLHNFKEARDDYNEILNGPWSEFVENSARHAAGIAYDQKDYAGAYAYYVQLRENTSNAQNIAMSFNGLMKSGFFTGKYPETILYADSLLAIPGISAETSNDAGYFKARALQQTDSLDAAKTIYTELAKNKNGDMAAESRYRIAEILLKQEKLKEAEQAANETIHLSAGYDLWIVKSYLVLADILVKQKDYFNARATLESIVKHTKIDEIKKEAQQRLDDVNTLEKHQSKLSDE